MKQTPYPQAPRAKTLRTARRGRDTSRTTRAEKTGEGPARPGPARNHKCPRIVCAYERAKFCENVSGYRFDPLTFCALTVLAALPVTLTVKIPLIKWARQQHGRRTVKKNRRQAPLNETKRSYIKRKAQPH